MAGVFDYKKEYKDLYMPKVQPNVIDVPEMTFIMVDGKHFQNIQYIGGVFFCRAYKNNRVPHSNHPYSLPIGSTLLIPTIKTCAAPCKR